MVFLLPDIILKEHPNFLEYSEIIRAKWKPFRSFVFIGVYSLSRFQYDEIAIS